MLFVVVEKGIKVKMDIKEKLVELLGKMISPTMTIREQADFLISNEATVCDMNSGYIILKAESMLVLCDKNALSFRKDTLYGGDLYETRLTDYCPNCGARMDEMNE